MPLAKVHAIALFPTFCEPEGNGCISFECKQMAAADQHALLMHLLGVDCLPCPSAPALAPPLAPPPSALPLAPPLAPAPGRPTAGLSTPPNLAHRYSSDRRSA